MGLKGAEVGKSYKVQAAQSLTRMKVVKRSPVAIMSMEVVTGSILTPKTTITQVKRNKNRQQKSDITE